jgi:predicted RNA-binding protein with PUA-like domain
MRYWLMKSEPDVYSITQLEQDGESLWEGVRNYVARNYMMKEMQPGDLVFFYHSNAKPSCIVGVAEVSGPAEPDPTQFQTKSDYYDPKSSKENPRWHCVKVRFKSRLLRPVSLEEIKKNKKLKDMVLLNNSRLSVQPVTKTEYETILQMAQKPEANS